MSEEIANEHQGTNDLSVLEKFQVQSPEMILWTILYSLLGVGLYILIELIPMPYTMVSLFAFGLAPALAIIAIVGAIRGPIAGLLTGYLGTLLYDLLFYSTVVGMTLPYLAYGVLGFVVGLASYDMTNGRSLMKMSVLSAVGFVFTVLLVVVIGLTLGGVSTLVEIGFVMLPLLTIGLPSVFFLTPLFARLWYTVMLKFMPEALPQ